jgi:hypothetical protein
MRQKAGTPKPSAEKIIKDIRRVTRKQYGAEEKIRIVLDGLRGEDSQVTTSISLSSTCDYSAPKARQRPPTAGPNGRISQSRYAWVERLDFGFGRIATFGAPSANVGTVKGFRCRPSLACHGAWGRRWKPFTETAVDH